MSDKQEQSGGIISELFHGWEKIILLLAFFFAALTYFSKKGDELLGADSPWKPWIWIGTFGILGGFYLLNVRPKEIKKKALKLRPTGEVKNDYFTTSPRENDRYKFFANGYESYAQWLREPQSPLLYLTGASGSGKSSLINAYLRPQLEERHNGKRTEVSVVRAYHDPLEQLQLALTQYGVESRGEATPESTNAMLKSASEMLSPGERILIVLDQFEEFFLLRKVAGENEESEAYRQEIETLRQFFRLFIKNPPTGVAILLSYRDDFQQLIDQLGLPARNEHINFEQLSPLLYKKAREFLTHCPGFVIPEERLEKVLEEASTVDSPITIRPIVLNILGIILQRMVDNPNAWKRDSNLIRSYILEGLGKEVEAERTAVLKAMLTDFETAKPRTVAELAKVSGLDINSLDNQLLAMSNHGLVRCLDKEETSPDKRKWQIAHDFIASKLEHVVHGITRTRWKRLRPWLAPAAVMLMIVTTAFVISGREEAAVQRLNEVGLLWDSESHTLSLAKGESTLTDQQLQHVVSYLQVLQPDSLKLQHAISLSTMDGLSAVTSLKLLDLQGCKNLTNIDGLKGLHRLTSLNMEYCNKVSNLSALEGLLSLTHLYAGKLVEVSYDRSKAVVIYQTATDSLVSLKGIGALKALKVLDLRGHENLLQLDYLDELTALTHLDLSGCTGLTNLNGLKGLNALTHLAVSGCTGLTNINGLKGLNALTDLDLSGCWSLTNADVLPGLPSLTVLDVSNCNKQVDSRLLRSLTGLTTLEMMGSHITDLYFLTDYNALSKLVISGCDSLTNVSGLQHLSSLSKLSLTKCAGLTQVKGIEHLPALDTLALSRCANLTSVSSLEDLPELDALFLMGCKGLTDISGLHHLPSLTELFLNECTAFHDIENLLKLKSLRKLDVSNCPLITKSEIELLRSELPGTEIVTGDK